MIISLKRIVYSKCAINDKPYYQWYISILKGILFLLQGNDIRMMTSWLVTFSEVNATFWCLKIIMFLQLAESQPVGIEFLWTRMVLELVARWPESWVLSRVWRDLYLLQPSQSFLLKTVIIFSCTPMARGRKREKLPHTSMSELQIWGFPCYSKWGCNPAIWASFGVCSKCRYQAPAQTLWKRSAI